MTPLSRRVLGRTLLARQHLLERTAAPVLDVVSQLVGLQAQVPRDPYLALWSRVASFEPEDLEAAYLDRSVVRIVVMRGTIHLVTAGDALGLRGLFQPVLDQEMARHGELKDALAAIDQAPVTTFAREQLRAPHTVAQLKTVLAERFPSDDPAAVALICRNTVPLVQIPPRGLWSRSGQLVYMTAEEWVGRPVEPAPSLEDALRRYLGAYGPATVADMTAWSRLTHLREVVERMRPTLRTWTDEDGRELFDVPDGEVVDGDAPAPVRFLPQYDNVLLSHAERSRVIPDPHPELYPGDRVGFGHVLVDGTLQASWRLHRPEGEAPVVTIRHAGGLSKRHRDALLAEAHRALPILSPAVPDAAVELIAR
jgi:hypothetical protein